MYPSFLSISGPFLYLCFFICTKVQALLNFTIDDADSAIVYTPSNKWNPGPACASRCSAHPDPNQTNGGTWHDGTHYSTDTGGYLKAEASFTGTAVTVYGIKGYGTLAARDLTFQIDGQQVGTYSQPDTVGHGFVYRFPFFSTRGLSNSHHTLTIINGANNANVSLLLLDYIEYSQEEQAPPASNPTTGNGGSSSNSQSTSTTSSGSQASQVSSYTASISSLTSSNSTAASGETTLATTSPTTVSATTTVTTTSSPLFSGLATPGSDTRHLNTTVVVGIVVGALIGILLVLILLIWWMRRRRMHSSWLLHSNTTMNNNANAGPERTRTSEIPSTFAFSRTRHPTIDPFHIEASASTSTVTMRKAMLDPKSSVSEDTSLTSSTLPADVQSRMVDTAITLAVEVQRLRGENDRLRGREQMANTDEVPPSYLQSLRSSATPTSPG